MVKSFIWKSKSGIFACPFDKKRQVYYVRVVKYLRILIHRI